MNKFTESEAWTYLAKLWSKSVLRGPYHLHYVVDIGGDTAAGLCSCVLLLEFNRRILRNPTATSMNRRIFSHKNYVAPYKHIWPTKTKRGAIARANFCRKMAKVSAGLLDIARCNKRAKKRSKQEAARKIKTS